MTSVKERKVQICNFLFIFFLRCRSSYCSRLTAEFSVRVCSGGSGILRDFYQHVMLSRDQQYIVPFTEPIQQTVENTDVKLKVAGEATLSTLLSLKIKWLSFKYLRAWMETKTFFLISLLILESPVFPVLEGQRATLSCRNKNIFSHP